MAGQVVNGGVRVRHPRPRFLHNFSEAWVFGVSEKPKGEEEVNQHAGSKRQEERVKSIRIFCTSLQAGDQEWFRRFSPRFEWDLQK